MEMNTFESRGFFYCFVPQNHALVKVEKGGYSAKLFPNVKQLNDSERVCLLWQANFVCSFDILALGNGPQRNELPFTGNAVMSFKSVEEINDQHDNHHFSSKDDV